MLWEQHNILREQDNMLWEQNNILREQNVFLGEQNNKLWEQDIILREQNIFFFRMALISQRTFHVSIFEFLKNWRMNFLRSGEQLFIYMSYF